MAKIYVAWHLLFATSLLSQNNSVAGGGNALGASGTVSYSIGQVFYHMPAGNGFSTLEGLQQPIEIIALATNEAGQAIPDIVIYPNPAKSEFSISFSSEDYAESEYILSDINGKEISSCKIFSKQTRINVEALPPAIYLLKIKTSTAETGYKIIKR